MKRRKASGWRLKGTGKRQRGEIETEKTETGKRQMARSLCSLYG
jgi:hypothetical protein